MTASMFSPLVQIVASGAGDVDGYKTGCTCCGLVLQSSLRTLIEQDMLDHYAWHERKGQK